jgi:hypothetical protein
MVVVYRSEFIDEPVTLTVDVNAGADVHVVSMGPNNLKVRVPVGFDPPEKLTLAQTWRPTIVDPEAVTIRVGPDVATRGAAAATAEPMRHRAAAMAAMRTAALPVSAPPLGRRGAKWRWGVVVVGFPATAVM